MDKYLTFGRGSLCIWMNEKKMWEQIFEQTIKNLMQFVLDLKGQRKYLRLTTVF